MEAKYEPLIESGYRVVGNTTPVAPQTSPGAAVLESNDFDCDQLDYRSRITNDAWRPTTAQWIINFASLSKVIRFLKEVRRTRFET